MIGKGAKDQAEHKENVEFHVSLRLVGLRWQGVLCGLHDLI